MQIDLTGRHAIVTGGAHGIGLAMAQTLAACGAQVTVFDLDAASPVDVTNRASLNAAFDRSPVPDIVMINAGTAYLRPIPDTTREVWDKTLALNLTAVFETLQAATNRMRAAGRPGTIVLTASTNSYDGEENLIAYNATKAGVLGLVHTAANELGPYGIRVNAVNPGLIQTRLTADSFNNETVIKEYFRAIPMGRGGQPEEVAKAAVFLASDWASYITGTTLLVDGGQMACKFGPWRDAEADFRDSRWQRR